MNGFRFGGQKVKGQGHGAQWAEAYRAERCVLSCNRAVLSYSQNASLSAHTQLFV